MASILITGAAGFIGSNLCRTLLNEGHVIHAVDNCITGHRANLVPFETHPNFSFSHLDITTPQFVSQFENSAIDEIYHLACPTGVPNIKKLAEEMVLTCSTGTLNVLSIAKRSGARLLFTSSAEVYGQPLQSPQHEHYEGNVHPTGARSAYEEGKRFSETCVMMYVRTHGVNARIVRVFNTFGPGMSLSDTRVIPQFLNSIIMREPLRIYGDGLQTRCHTYVDDLIAGLRIAMEKGDAGEAYNIGNDSPMTVRDLASLIIELAEYPGDIVFEPHFIEDHRHRRPATDKIRALDWKPIVPINEGLRRMIAHYVPVSEPSPTEMISTPTAAEHVATV